MKREDLQFSKELTGDIKGMKFGVPEEYLAEGLDPEVKASFMGVLDTLKELGAEVEFFSIKTMEYMIPAYYIIASAEASSNLERFDGVKYGFRAAEYEGLHDMYKKTRTAGFGEEVKRRIMLGSFVLSSGYYDAYYLKALRTKALIKKEFDQAFGKYDVLLAPASPFTAPKIGESLKDPLAMYLGDIYTVAVNLCGLPGITVPCGKDSKGLPIGIQMIGDCFIQYGIACHHFGFHHCKAQRSQPLHIFCFAVGKFFSLRTYQRKGKKLHISLCGNFTVQLSYGTAAKVSGILISIPFAQFLIDSLEF